MSTSTPSLRARQVRTLLPVVLALQLLVSVTVTVALRSQLSRGLDDLLATRAGAAATVLERDRGRLLEQLQAAGIPAVVTAPDGAVRIVAPAATSALPVPSTRGAVSGPARSTTLTGADGTVVEVFASEAGVRTTLGRLVVLQALGLVATALLGWVAVRRVTDRTMAALADMAAVADRIGDGALGERIDPDDPTTELGRLATAFDAMVASLEDAVATARAADERGKRFLEDAAHQLRTPLSVIRASVEAILRDPAGTARDELLFNVVRETSRSADLLADLLRLTRLDQGELPEATTWDLAALVRQEAARLSTVRPGLDVAVDAPSVLEVRGREEAVAEAVGNVLDNAGRFARTRVDVRVVATAGGGEVTVTDDGPGVPPERRERVFERFYGDGGGSGLGLAIARGIARAHRGDLVLEGPSTFRLELTSAGASARRAVADAGDGLEKT